MSPARPQPWNSARTGCRHFLPWEDRPAAWPDARLAGCSAQLDSLSLPGELQLVVVCSSSAVRGTSSVWGGERRERNSRCCAGAQPGPGTSQSASPGLCGLHGHMPMADPQPLSPCQTAPCDPFQGLGTTELIPRLRKPPWAPSLQLRTNISLFPPLRPGISLPFSPALPPCGGLCRKGAGGWVLAFLWPSLPG